MDNSTFHGFLWSNWTVCLSIDPLLIKLAQVLCPMVAGHRSPKMANILMSNLKRSLWSRRGKLSVTSEDTRASSWCPTLVTPHGAQVPSHWSRIVQVTCWLEPRVRSMESLHKQHFEHKRGCRDVNSEDLEFSLRANFREHKWNIDATLTDKISRWLYPPHPAQKFFFFSSFLTISIFPFSLFYILSLIFSLSFFLFLDPQFFPNSVFLALSL